MYLLLPELFDPPIKWRAGRVDALRRHDDGLAVGGRRGGDCVAEVFRREHLHGARAVERRVGRRRVLVRRRLCVQPGPHNTCSVWKWKCIF